MKYKIGDKVILLEGVIDVGIPPSSIGKECTVIHDGGEHSLIIKESGIEGNWYLSRNMVKSFIPVGEQLLFSFMKD